MDCARCGVDTGAPILDDGKASVLDSITNAPEHGLPFRLFKFMLWRAKDEANEIERLHLCAPCALKLGLVAWLFIDGKLHVPDDPWTTRDTPKGVM